MNHRRYLCLGLALGFTLSCGSGDDPTAVTQGALDLRPSLAKGGSGGANIAGRWEGTLVTSPGICSNPGTSVFFAHLTEVSSGRLSGSIRVYPPGATPVQGKSVSLFGDRSGTSVEFDAGGESIYFIGTLTSADAMSGTIGPVSPTTTCPQGTWSAARVP